MARSPIGVRRFLQELILGVVDAEQLEDELVQLEDSLEAVIVGNPIRLASEVESGDALG